MLEPLRKIIVVTAIFPSSPRRGGCATKKMARSHRSGADGVFAHEQSYKTHCEIFSLSDHPVRSFKGGFATSFLVSRPPLLTEEGNMPQERTSNLFCE